jgi:hypothetical protein
MTRKKNKKWAWLSITDREAIRFLKFDSKRFHVPMAVLLRVILGQHLLKAGVLKGDSQLDADIRRLPEAAKKLYVR